MKKEKLDVMKWVLAGLLMLPMMSALADSSYDASQIPAMLTQNFHLCAQILQTFSVATGFIMFASSIHGFKAFGDKRGMMQQQAGMTGPLVKLICAGLLMSPALWLNTALLALTGNASPEANPFAGLMGDEFASSLSWAAILGVKVLGMGMFINGIHKFAKAGGQNAQQGMIGKGLCFCVSGVCLVHIVAVVETVYMFLFGSGTFF